MAKRTAQPPQAGDRPAKRANRGQLQSTDSGVEHELLAQYYSEVRTLREYALAKLPASSRIRRRKIASVGLPSAEKTSEKTSEKTAADEALALGQFLDTTLVACRGKTAPDTEARRTPDLRWQQWIGFSQRADESYVTLSDGLRGSIYSQSEIVDFVVWLLFSREKGAAWPKNLLCDGFRKHVGPNVPSGPAAECAIPGVFSVYPNRRFQALKEAPWPQLLLLLGKEGERIMIDLLIDCAIFEAVKAGKGNLCQLSGKHISDLESLTAEAEKQAKPKPAPASERSVELRPSEITFVRNRMLYARAALNARGLVHFGLRHIHVLNRFPHRAPEPEGDAQPSSKPEPKSSKVDDGVIHIMMYIFPRQFGLHNVSLSLVDRQQTAQRFQDYTLREEEIAKKFPKKDSDGRPLAKHIPKRLRGTLPHLVERLQVLHGRCAYSEMIQHYCPVAEQIENERKAQPSQSKPARDTKKKPRQSTAPTPEMQYDSLIELATPVSSVSAFCQAVLSKIIPNDFWGKGLVQEHNKEIFLKNVRHFIYLRRFESMCLHEAMQGLKITDIEWLTPPGMSNQKCSQSDLRKRTEIFFEFLYYLFDSLLIPLIRSNFYVTESNVHKYRLFFFRQDVWRYVAEPAMASIKAKMFEEVRLDDALRILQSRRLGLAQIRLLPKKATVRPIMNLRRRTMTKGSKNVLGPSINSVLGPVGSMLKLERSLNPSRLGSALFSIGDIYKRIKAFRAELGNNKPKLYFAKVDVQAAFDTIPQEAMIRLLKRIPKQSRYKLAKHVEVQPLETTSNNPASVRSTKRWHSVAQTAGDTATFPQKLEGALAASKKNTVFVDSAAYKTHDTRELLALTETHIAQNLVRIGKKYYRQKSGIPQGSVLSSTLCNYFYADLERKHLGFLRAEGCLLLRLIDDFLLVTTEREKAVRFVTTMHQGMPEYGVTVSLGKSLVSFPLALDGVTVPMSAAGQGFPYCGLLIDYDTLGVAKQRETEKDLVVFNSLTVEFAKCPGQNFKRKVLNSFKIQSHLMFFDTSHNSRRSVFANAYAAFVETATKMWAYARCLPQAKRPSSSLLIDTVKALVEVAFLLLTSKSRKARYPGYDCTVRKTQLAWLAMVACKQVLVKKQSGYKEVISWLEQETQNLSNQKGLDCRGLVKVVKALPGVS